MTHENDSHRDRLNRLADDRAPMSRAGDMTTWWFDLVNAWFLCDLIRTSEWKLEEPAHTRRVLSTTIVWG